jgi:hypothetical protein
METSHENKICHTNTIQNKSYMKFEVLAAVIIQTLTFWMWRHVFNQLYSITFLESEIRSLH